MAELPAPWLAGARRPWPKPQVTPDLTYCPRCRGTLPPDTEAACQECGTGTPPGLPPVPLLIVDEEPKLTEEETAEPVPSQPAEPIGWTTMLKSWARWPNV